MSDCYVITRSYMEDCYLNCFIHHYISLNFTKIIILKSDNSNFNLLPQYKNKTEIHYVKNEGNLIYDNNKNIYKNLNGWLLFIDVDEFLILNEKYHNNIQNFVNNLQKNINCILFRWLMIEKYNNNTNGINIKNIIKNYHKHKNSHVKSMVKSNVLLNMKSPHVPSINTQPFVYFENNIINNLNPKQTLSNNSYKDCYLIHIHTRSITNIITKSLNSYNNMCSSKIIKNKHNFINFINKKLYLSSNNILNDFKNLIGCKATLPFSHSNNNKIEVIFSKINHDSLLIDIKNENEMLKKYCIGNNLNYDNLNEFMKKLNCYGNHLFKKSNFDWKKYISNYSDLNKINNEKEALNHYLNHGIKEGRKYN